MNISGLFYTLTYRVWSIVFLVHHVSKSEVYSKFSVNNGSRIVYVIHLLFSDSGWSEFFGELEKNSRGRVTGFFVRATIERNNRPEVEVFTVSLKQCLRAAYHVPDVAPSTFSRYEKVYDRKGKKGWFPVTICGKISTFNKLYQRYSTQELALL